MLLFHLNELQLRFAYSVPTEIGTLHRDQYPMRAIAELLVNAFVHRNYAITSNHIRITWHSKELHIQSPGRFPDGINCDNVGSKTIARNSIMVAYWHAYTAPDGTKLFDQVGKGISTARKLIEERGGELRFIEDDYSVTAIITASGPNASWEGGLDIQEKQSN